jgi:hypothetical protein
VGDPARGYAAGCIRDALYAARHGHCPPGE